jgi:hypothetical protein
MLIMECVMIATQLAVDAQGKDPANALIAGVITILKQTKVFVSYLVLQGITPLGILAQSAARSV